MVPPALLELKLVGELSSSVVTEGWPWPLFPTPGMLAQGRARRRSASGSCGRLACGRQRDPLCQSYTFFGAEQERSFPSFPGDGLLISWALEAQGKGCCVPSRKLSEFCQVPQRERVAAPSSLVAPGHEQMHQDRHLHVECTRAACGMRKRHC